MQSEDIEIHCIECGGTGEIMIRECNKAREDCCGGCFTPFECHCKGIAKKGTTDDLSIHFELKDGVYYDYHQF